MRKAFFLLIILLIPAFIAYSEPMADFRPGYKLVYRGEAIIVFTSLCPPKYASVPMYIVNISVETDASHYKYYGYCFLVNNSLEKNFIWRQIPFFTKKYLKIGDKVEYNGRTWTVEKILYVNFSQMFIESIFLRSGKCWRIYDRASGILLKGHILVGNRSFYVELAEHNLEWIYLKYNNIYIDWFTLTKILKEINKTYSIIRVYSIGRSVLDRDIWAVEVGYPNASEVILVSAGIHGTEVVGIRVSLYTLKKLLLDKECLRSLARNKIKVIFVLPLNPDGLESGKVSPRGLGQIPYVRKNARLVDLNRNFESGWKKGGSTDIRSSKYRGPYPFSEPETRAFRDFVRRLKIIYHIDLHSGAEWVIVPPAVSREKDKVAQRLAWVFADKLGYELVQGGVAGLAYYYTYSTKPEVVSIIVELYRASSDEWFSRYNPVRLTQLNSISEKFYSALVLLVQNPSLTPPFINYLPLYVMIALTLTALLYLLMKTLRKHFR